MKTAAISRFVVVAAIAALVAMAGVTPVLAQSPNFPNFSSVANLTRNGNAAQSGTVLRLTPTLQSQAGSAWFNVKQPVTGSFTTTFTFRISNDQETFSFPADGIAFVIQNSPVIDSGGGAGALGGAGGGIGFLGIPNSLAVEFDTFPNGNLDNNNANHVAVQSCMNLPNTVDETSSCSLGQNYSLPITLADGSPHTATITYVPPPTGSGPGRLDVILDNTDLFPAVTGEGAHPAGVSFDLTTLGLDNGTAWVGFTGATGALVENNDILSWTFTPQAQSAVITAGGGAAVLAFEGGLGNNAYDYTAQLNNDARNTRSATIRVKPILITEEACEQLVKPIFAGAQCFVYQNAAGLGVDSAVMFEVTCPDQPGGTCGSNELQDFYAELGTDFTFSKAENPGFQLLNSTIGPRAGWLKGVGPDPLNPCTPNQNNTPALFQSNQIDSFSVQGDPTGHTKGGSGGAGSCWVATFGTPGEAPPGIKITSPTFFATYNRNQVVAASYTCSNPKTSQNPLTSPVGPYLTVASCTQSQTPNPSNQTQAPGCVPGQVCTGGLDTSVKGLHVFQVTSKDSGGNVNVNFVAYFVR